MKPLVKCLLLILLLCACGDSPSVVAEESTISETPATQLEGLPPEVELEEMRIVIRTLANENRQLKAELEALRAAQELPQPKEIPAVPLPQSTDPAQVSQPETPSTPPQVLYVNPTWHYLVVDRGSAVGVRKDQQLKVTRNGVLIAYGTVTDAKADQSVADIDVQSIGTGGLYPAVGDTVEPR